MQSEIAAHANSILQQVKRRMFGMDDVVRLCLVALYTDGHVLLEGNPGLGKTELVKTLGDTLGVGFGRIQFTPDLMPADITGTYMPDLEDSAVREWRFRPGPIFASLLLADEINRATPKTQSAMLEAMAERQVTVLGSKHSLPRPFMVLATQNPIDQEGTYNLPEAQADRFMFKIAMPVPSGETLLAIMHKQAGRVYSIDGDRAKTSGGETEVKRQNAVDSAAALKRQHEFRSKIEEVTPLPSLQDHIRNMFLASNQRFAELMDIKDQAQRREVERLSRLITYGLGPRAAIALMLGVKAWSVLFPPEPEGVEGASQAPALARVVVPVLRHRVKLNFNWQERYTGKPEPEDGYPPGLLEQFLKEFCLITAPSAAPSQRLYRDALRRDLSEIAV